MTMVGLSSVLSNQDIRVVLLLPQDVALPAVPPSASWQQAWAQAGLVVCATVHQCHDLVHTVQTHAPQGVLVWADAWDDGLSQSLSLLYQCAPCPVLLCLPMPTLRVGGAVAVDHALPSWAALARTGAHLLWRTSVMDDSHPDVRPIWAWCSQAFAAHQEQRERVLDLETRWRERVVVDKAKGILMQAQHLSDEEAFALLRRTSMSRSQRLGELARQVVTSAQQADCLNRSGQLRMLSQRWSALTLLKQAGLSTPATEQAQAQTHAKVQASLHLLAQQVWPPDEACGMALTTVVQTWETLQQLKPPRRTSGTPSVRYLCDLQARAQQVLEAADHLTVLLQTQSQAAPMRWLNTVGRQRMLCQRYTFQVLLQAWIPSGPVASALRADQQQTRAELETVLGQLNHLPLRNAAIDACLSAVGVHWLGLVHIGQACVNLPPPQSAQAQQVLTELFERSDAVLGTLESLTQHVERSLEWLLA